MMLKLSKFLLWLHALLQFLQCGLNWIRVQLPELSMNFVHLQSAFNPSQMKVD